MDRFLDFLLLFLAQFAGGPGPIENNLVRFALPSVLWGILLAVAISRRRSQALSRERLLTWGFGLGLARELFMLIQVSGRLLSGLEHPLHQPLEHALAMAAVVVVAGAFLQYILDDARLSRRYIQVGLGMTSLCLLVAFWAWPRYLASFPDAQFHAWWGAWLFHAPVAVLIATAIVFLQRRRGWLRNVVIVALTFFFLGEFLFLLNYVTDRAYGYVFCRVGNASHILAIPLLGYVYFREQAMERRRAEQELIALNAIATTVSRSLDLDRMLSAILDKVIEVVPADIGWIRLLDQDGETLLLAAERGQAPEMSSSEGLEVLSKRVTEDVLRSGRAIVQGVDPADRVLGESTRSRNVARALVCVPVQARGAVVGSLCVLTSLGQAGERKVELLTAIGNQVSVAVENAWLTEEAAQAEIWKELNRLRSELIANVSHEIRTPLGLIKLSSTSLLAEDVEFDPETMRMFLQGIDQETERLEKIVDNLLDLSQIESGRLRLDRQQTDVAQLAREVIEGIQVQSADHTIVHNFVEPLLANVDRKRIEQVLRNLLSNAIKYSGKEGSILVQGYEDRGAVHIQVSDEGIGIPPDDLERVFERFYRVENETTKSAGGVGLGLAVCRRIVEAHGGRIWAESDLDLGSTFYVVLPLVDEEAARMEAPILQAEVV